jgi:hypothetical protein
MNRARRTLAAAAAFLAMGALLLACGGTGPSSQVSSASPTGASASGSGVPGPGPSRWPGSAVRATLAVGVADNEVGEATADLQRSLEEEDLALMRRAAAGLAGLDVIEDRLSQMEQFEVTRPLALRYREALTPLVAAATELRDAIDAGDGPRIQQANLDLAAALADYVALRPEISELVSQALFQQRQLLR